MINDNFQNANWQNDKITRIQPFWAKSSLRPSWPVAIWVDDVWPVVKAPYIIFLQWVIKGQIF